MKKTILTFSLLVFMAGFTTGYAQEQVKNNKKEQIKNLSPQEIAKKKTDHMTKMLGLDESQQESIYDANLKHAIEKSNLKAERLALKEKGKAEKIAHQSRIEQLLTDEQKAKLAEHKANRDEKKSNHHKK